MRQKSIIRRHSQTQALVNYVNRHGLKLGGIKYGCSSATLSRWLHQQGYDLKRQWVKAEDKNETISG